MAFCASVALRTPSRQQAPLRQCGPLWRRAATPRASGAAELSRRAAVQAGVLGALGAALGTPSAAQALSRKRMLAKAGPPIEMDNGITFRDITVGKGNSPRDGDTVAIHYSLFYNDFEVESSRESQGLAASPIGFTFGATAGPGAVMAGINQGISGMKVGGTRLITVPPALAYGDRGKVPLIPGGATVEFAVSLLSCKRAGSNPNSIIDPKAQVF